LTVTLLLSRLEDQSLCGSLAALESNGKTHSESSPRKFPRKFGTPNHRRPLHNKVNQLAFEAMTKASRRLNESFRSESHLTGLEARPVKAQRVDDFEEGENGGALSDEAMGLGLENEDEDEEEEEFPSTLHDFVSHLIIFSPI
jgi:hypothetical protein